MIDVRKQTEKQVERLTQTRVMAGGLDPKYDSYLEGRIDSYRDVIGWLAENDA